MEMKLDRPYAYWEQKLTGRLMYTEPSRAEQGWRREHAARVFQAIQAVFAVVGAYESASSLHYLFGHAGASYAAEIDAAAGWRYWRVPR